MPLNPIIAATTALSRLDGVAGVILFKGENVVHRQMPFSEQRSDELISIIKQMMDGYTQVRRKMRLVHLEFDGGLLLFMIQEGVVLITLLTPKADPDMIASAGSILLADNARTLSALSTAASATPPPVDQIEELVVTTPRAVQQIAVKAESFVSNWGEVRKVLEGLLSKVMGRAQATNLVNRCIEKENVGDPYRLQPAAVTELATAVINQVPNNAKRRQLQSELDSALENLTA
ncbi:MAG: hypothetical protein KDK97_11260 [Verrucomicrobiales bacterium]|nr:hypothetical protein [Verrucomicrobiales bacterium]MCP5558672.1 hypothetical protein [Verrucomicrobiaceae bacterium]